MGKVPPEKLAELKAKAVGVEKPKRPCRPVPPFTPFPVDALPGSLATFTRRAAEAIGCDTSYIGAPLLAMLGACIGTTRCLRLKTTWREFPALWVGIVGDSGTQKTPALGVVTDPVEELQRKAFAAYEAEYRLYEQLLAGAKKDAPKPDEPVCERLVVSDATCEALAPILKETPRGVLLVRDELAGWVGGFDKYSGGKSKGDSAHWLSVHSGKAFIIDRKTGTPRRIYVPRPFVGIVGGIQPGILKRTLGREHRDSGLAARLLLTMPPRRPKRWRDEDVDQSDLDKLAQIVCKLRELQHNFTMTGEQIPVDVQMDEHARGLFIGFVNEHGEEQAGLVGDMAAAWSKLEGYTARIALIHYFARWAGGEVNGDAVDAQSMRQAIKLVGWFKGEAVRVYAVVDQDDEAAEADRLVELVLRLGTPTAREVVRRSRQFANAAEAEVRFDALVQAGRLVSFYPSGPGRPAKRYGPPPPIVENAQTEDSKGCVDETPVLGVVETAKRPPNVDETPSDGSASGSNGYVDTEDMSPAGVGGGGDGDGEDEWEDVA